MIRSSRQLQRTALHFVSRASPVSGRTLMPSGSTSTASSFLAASRTSALATHHQWSTSRMALRALSSSAGKGEEKKSQTAGGEEDAADTKEIVLTPGEKVAAAGRLTFWVGVGVFASACAYFIGKELLPTKMSPNRVFDRSFDIIRKDSDIIQRFGDPLKAYGRDHGGHREGRRNFIEHTEYKNEEDGSNRTRVRYNLEGRFGNAFVFAEVSSDMPSGEFVYVLVQDKSNGRVHTVVDNRASLTAQRLAGGKEAQGAMAQLLSGGKK